VTFFYGCRSERDLVSPEEISLNPRRNDRFEFINALSGEAPDHGDSIQPRFVHEVVRERLGDEIRHYEAYVAGPPKMVDATFQMLLQSGLMRENIHFDSFY
jgi:Na+-transporting NADH:ubiquinone oxidoreductase subunit NqrF